jgi:hypothetical protein
MKVLITGKGGEAGSWAIRAIQLGAAMGATVKARATEDDCRAHDIIVVVKRPASVLPFVKQSGRPWVFDVVDGWPQPCSWDKSTSVRWLQYVLEKHNPRGVVYGTPQMEIDAGRPGLVLPHHSWQRYLDHIPTVRDRVKVLGYEGDPAYLGRWHSILKRECAERGWHLAINEDMRQADIALALRDTGGYPAKFWKPNTKVANAQALGIPAICSPEHGYQSFGSGREFYVNTEQELHYALHALTDLALRKRVSVDMRAAAIPVEEVALKYKRWLENVC